MKKKHAAVLTLLSMMLANLCSCSTTTDRATAAAEQLVQLSVDGLGSKHPRRLELVREIEELGEDPAELEKKAGYARAEKLSQRQTKLRRQGLGRGHPKVQEIQREIDRLRVYRSSQRM